MSEIPPFNFRSKEEIETLPVEERALYFEDMLADFCNRMEQFNVETEHLGRLVRQRRLRGIADAAGRANAVGLAS